MEREAYDPQRVIDGTVKELSVSLFGWAAADMFRLVDATYMGGALFDSGQRYVLRNCELKPFPLPENVLKKKAVDEVSLLF